MVISMLQNPMEHFEYMSTGNVKLHGVMFDAPPNPKAVMCIAHGLGGHCERFDRMAEWLKGQNVAVAGISYRGHGRSEGARGICRDYDYLRDDLECLLNHAEDRYPGVPKFLFGFSMGGGLVLNYVLKRGLSNLYGVISVAPMITLSEEPSRLLQKVLRVMEKVMPDFTMTANIVMEHVNTIPEEQLLCEQDEFTHETISLSLAKAMVDEGAWTLSQADQWTAPLLVMHSRTDKLTSYIGSHAFAMSAQNAKHIPFDHAGHEIHHDICRYKVYQAITAFIDEQLAARARDTPQLMRA